MVPLRFVLLLAIVSTMVLTGGNATPRFNLAGSTQRNPTAENGYLLQAALNGSLFNRYNRGPCIPRYEQMIREEPKAVITMIEKPHSVCVSPTGNFVVASYAQHGRFFIFNSCGFIIKRAKLPHGASVINDCAFTRDAIYLTDFGAKKIYKYSINGIFEKVFAFGYRFQQVAALYNRVFTTIAESKMILAYDASTGREALRFHTAIGDARGLAFDRHNHLHVSSKSNTIEVFDFEGKKLSQRTYMELNVGDGLTIDDHDNTVITDRTAPQKVLVYRPNNILLARLQEYDSPTDVAIGRDCSLYVTDYGAGKIYIY